MKVERSMNLPSLATRNFWRHRSRYSVLLSIVALGMALGLLLLGAVSSLGESLRLKASLYFGGDVAVLGYAPDGRHRNGDEAVLPMLQDSGIAYRSLSRRTVSYQSETLLFFSNNSLKQRRLIGVDLEFERKALEALDLSEGSIDGLATGAGILVSQVTAAKLGVRTGDTCTLLVDTVDGSKNTLPVVVSGIFRDTSFFGYSSYLAIETLNQALNLPPGSSTEVGMTLDAGASAGPAATRLYQALAAALPQVTLLTSKAELDALDQSPLPSDTFRYAVMTLDVRLAQIQEILDALAVVSVVLNGLFLIIVVLGVGNTFRAVLVERTREIGVYRALGMVRSRLVCLILAEVAVLAACGGLVGTALGTLALFGLTAIDWGQQSLAAMFLRRGHLAWSWPFWQAGALFLVSIAVGALGAVGPALKAARWKPVDALRHRA